MTATASEFDLDAARKWIGREESAHDVLTPELVRRYRATFDRPAGAVSHGALAPALIHFCLAPVAALTSELAEDGHPKKGGFLPPIPLPRRMWAGGSIKFNGSLRIGDQVKRTSRIADVAMKAGKTGVLGFVTVAHEISVGGVCMISEQQDIVYRAPATLGRGQGDMESANDAPHRQAVSISSPLLFRYSALTFNAHRIHYDRDYATGPEGYPGLVVHGPLQAALLINYAIALKGRMPTQFSFRSGAPLFDTDKVHLNAAPGSEGFVLWTTGAGGGPAMEALAKWS